jgi:hypothetical protein
MPHIRTDDPRRVGAKSYHQLAIEYPANAGFAMMADRERVMMVDPNGTLAQLRELRQLLRLGACSGRDATAAADIIARAAETFGGMRAAEAVGMALEIARVRET